MLPNALSAVGHYADENPAVGAVAIGIVVGLFGVLVAAAGSFMALPVFAVAGLLGYGAYAVSNPGAGGLQRTMGAVSAGFGRAFLLLAVAVAIIGSVLAVYFLWEFLKMVWNAAWETFFE